MLSPGAQRSDTVRKAHVRKGGVDVFFAYFYEFFGGGPCERQSHHYRAAGKPHSPVGIDAELLRFRFSERPDRHFCFLVGDAFAGEFAPVSGPPVLFGYFEHGGGCPLAVAGGGQRQSAGTTRAVQAGSPAPGQHQVRGDLIPGAYTARMNVFEQPFRLRQNPVQRRLRDMLGFG